MRNIHTTGPFPFIMIVKAAELGGCLDAPEFVPTGATACEETVAVWSRDEIAAALDADLI